MKTKKLVVSILVLSIFNAGCVTSTPNPVPIAQIGDDTKTCEAIANEMQLMQNQRLQAEGDRNSQVGGNVALGVLGAFFIVPLFFMNTGNAHTVEEKAAIARYERLQQMGIDRKCPAIPVLKPSSDSIAATVKENGQVERITLTSETQSSTSTNSQQSFELARDRCAQSFSTINEAYGNCVLQASKFKPNVVTQIGYNKVCENIGFKVDTPAMGKCVNDLVVRPMM
jgi:hypothetical protein